MAKAAFRRQSTTGSVGETAKPDAFPAVDAELKTGVEQGGEAVIAVRDVRSRNVRLSVEYVRLRPGSWGAVKDDIQRLESLCFNPERRFGNVRLKSIYADPYAVNLVAKVDGRIVGYVHGGPLESPHFRDLEGVTADSNYGKYNTYYGGGVAVDPAYQGLGISKFLHDESLKIIKTSAGPTRKTYEYKSGRTERGTPTNRFFRRKGAVFRTIPGRHSKTKDDMEYYSLPLNRV